MYLLIIKLVFLCPSGNIQSREITFPKTSYKEAVEKLEFFDRNVGKLTEHFNDENCDLDEVFSGHRNMGKNEQR